MKVILFFLNSSTRNHWTSLTPVNQRLLQLFTLLFFLTVLSVFATQCTRITQQTIIHNEDLAVLQEFEKTQDPFLFTKMSDFDGFGYDPLVTTPTYERYKEKLDKNPLSEAYIPVFQLLLSIGTYGLILRTVTWVKFGNP